MTTFEQAWQDAYGTPEAWERERHGTADEAQSEVYGTPQSWQARQRRRASARRLTARQLCAQELADTREAARLTRERRAGA